MTSVAEQVDHFRTSGNRFRFELYPGMDHMAWGASDLFRSAADHMGTGTRTVNPGHIVYGWYPNLDATPLGVFTTGAYWVRAPKARTVAAGTMARVEAVSTARPETPFTPNLMPGSTDPGYVPAGSVLEQTWTLGIAPKPGTSITLDLRDVAELTLDLSGAGIKSGTLKVTTDGPTVIHTSAGDFRAPQGTTTFSF